MYLKTIKLIALIIMLSVIEANAQSITNSPYSRYGLGDISYLGLGHSVAMGGTSIAESTPFYVNTVNPAANTNFSIQRFIFDVGFDVNYRNTSNGSFSKKNSSSSFRYFAGGFAAKPWWVFAFSFKPYSSVGYSLSDSTVLNYDDQKLYYSETVKGEGGLNKVTLSTAFKFLKMFSVGVNGSVLFGNIERSNNIYSTRSLGTILGESATYTSNTYYNNSHVIHGLQADLGFRFEKSFRSKKDTLVNAFKISLGGYLGNKADLKSRNELMIYNWSQHTGSAYKVTSITDTIAHDTLYSDVVTLPKGFGLGISTEIYEKLTLNADYQKYNWGGFKFPGHESTSNMRDSKYFGVGMQYVNRKYSSKFYNLIHYRIGYHSQQTYMTVNGHGIDDKGFTFGIGLPVRSLFLNVGCDFGKRGTTEHNLYEEKYYLLHFSVSFIETWFVKHKYR